jgi:hypothetical protein
MAMPRINEPGQRGFLLWLKANQPRLYGALTKQLRTGLSGLGLAVPSDIATSAPASPASSSWVDSIKDVVMTAAQTYLTKQQVDAQKKVLDIQLQRAQQGLPPLNLDLAQYGLTPTANVGLAPDTMRLVMWGGLALAAVYLLPKLLK